LRLEKFADVADCCPQIVDGAGFYFPQMGLELYRCHRDGIERTKSWAVCNHLCAAAPSKFSQSKGNKTMLPRPFDIDLSAKLHYMNLIVGLRNQVPVARKGVKCQGSPKGCF
jgi:hypothetical protein